MNIAPGQFIHVVAMLCLALSSRFTSLPLVLLCLALPFNAVQGQRSDAIRPALAIATAREERSSSRQSILAALEQALLAQRKAWIEYEVREHGKTDGTHGIFVEPDMKRHANAFCPDFGGFPVNIQQLNYPVWNVIRTADSVFVKNRPLFAGIPGPRYQPIRTVCPDWIPPEALRSNKHEAKGALPTPAELIPFPATLIERLVSAHRTTPNDDVVFRQLVRVLTENSDIARAAEVTAQCDARRAWCGLLRGYVLSLQQRSTEALESFTRSVALLPPAQRCDWETIPIITLGAEGSPMRRAWCGGTGATAALWWLAVPMYSDSVDWRRLEHNVRHARNAMAMDLPFDAHYDLTRSRGAEVIVAMRLRYGWAPHLVSTGEEVDAMAIKSPRSAPPISAAEYDMNRVATFPLLRAGLAPFGIGDDDFQFTAPDSISPYRWWPVEHFRHPGGIIERIAQQQRAILRRDSTAVLVVASDVRGGRLDSIGTTSVQAALVVSPNPDSVAILARTRTTRGSTVVLHSEFNAPGIAGFEYLVNADGLAGSRTRFGIEHVPTLGEMPTGVCAISDPVLVRADALTGKGIRNAFDGMLGSLSLDKPTRIGVVWESYGFSDADSARVTVQVVRTSEISRLRRLGMAMGVADDPNSSVTIQWQEPRAPGSRTVTEGKVPIIARQLVVNIERLREGEYVLAVSMEKAGCARVRSEREFRVLR